MTIKDVEAIVGITKKNIRFYERMGLLRPDRDHDNSYRNYGNADVERLKTIKLLRSLYLPIEDIRRILGGEVTAAACLRGHAAHLRGEIDSLGVAQALCAEIGASAAETVDVDVYLENLHKHEKEGVKFMNVKKRDTRKQYIMPVVCAVVMVLFMAAMIGLFFWAMAQEDKPPLAVIVILAAIPASVAIGVLVALAQRIQEINKGELDEARQY